MVSPIGDGMGRHLSTQIIVRFAAALTVGLVISSCGRACGGDAPVVRDQDEPTSAAAVEALIPADAAWAVRVNSIAHAMDAYAELRPHLLAILGGDLGIVETDLRNTLGLDLADTASIFSAGLDPDTPVVLADLDGHLVVALGVIDFEVFASHLADVATAPPFSLRGDPVRRNVGGAAVLEVGPAADTPPSFAVAFRDGVALVLPDAANIEVDDTVEALFGGTRGHLAESAGYADASALDAGALIRVHVSPEALANRHEQAVRDALAADAFSANRLLERMRESGPVSATVRVEENTIEIASRHALAQRTNETIAAMFDGLEAPSFAPLAVPDVYAFMRLTAKPELLHAALTASLSPQGISALAEATREASTTTGADVVATLLPALGPNAAVLLTRARLLTLSRAMNSGSPGEFFSGLGVVVALEVRDVEAVRAALEAIPEALDGRATQFEDEGRTVIEFTDAQADIGNLVLADDLLLLVPSRQRQEVLSMLAANTVDVDWCDVESARGLLTQEGENGFYIDLARVSDGPIGQVAFARLPVEARRALSRIARVTAHAGPVTGGATWAFSLRLAENGTEGSE